MDASCEPPGLCHFNRSLISRKAVAITTAFVLLTMVVVTIVMMIATTTTNNDGKKLTTTELEIVSVSDWGGRPAKVELTKLVLPVHHVIISHTAFEACETKEECASRVRIVQNFHMDSYNWDHIGYNFLVGGDGRVYEGRGWNIQGAHTLKYNVDSIGISFIGNFVKVRPTEEQLHACQLLIAEGVRLKKIATDYRLYGHGQLRTTESPGAMLYGIIQKWPNWSKIKPQEQES
ncbi:hypothetical protein KR222_006312 [Zaprionus bogoriensis]|nr:hypothetical protein KR222_006312 [Zaprionus bogoriensis]